MNIAHIIETALFVLVAFLIGAILGYIIRCMFFRPTKAVIATAATANATAPTPAPKPASTAKATVTAEPDGKPVPLSGPRDGKKDDLKRIKGIGPKIEGTLNGLGVYHFDQVAGWSSKTVGWVNGFLTFKGRIQREKWISQAKLLVKGRNPK